MTLSPRHLKYIPNILTIFRLILIGPYLYYLSIHQYVYTFYLFIFAGMTDALDGWMARQFHWQTPLGALIDPLADKLLVASSFISLALLNQLPWWLVILVFMRDFTISCGFLAWYWCITRQFNCIPTMLSKINTTLQLLLVTLCIYQLAFYPINKLAFYSVMLLTTITTAITYINYVWSWGKKAYTIYNT